MTPPPLGVALVDAFTRTPGAGNRAGVVVDARDLPDAAMARIAAAVAVSETAFVCRPTAGADVRLRWFTPTTEVPFCGHATVATFHRLAEVGRLAVPGRYTLECRAGRLAVALERDGAAVRVWVATPVAAPTPSPFPEGELWSWLGGTPAMRDPSLPIEQGGEKAFVPLRRRADLHVLAPRWRELAAGGTAHGVSGFHCFTREAAEPGHAAQARFFAPGWGVNEDPVTGSASGPLGAYLVRHGIVARGAGGAARLRLEQGDAMGKPGRVDVVVDADGARIGGVAVTVLVGALA